MTRTLRRLAVAAVLLLAAAPASAQAPLEQLLDRAVGRARVRARAVSNFTTVHRTFGIVVTSHAQYDPMSPGHVPWRLYATPGEDDFETDFTSWIDALLVLTLDPELLDRLGELPVLRTQTVAGRPALVIDGRVDEQGAGPDGMLMYLDTVDLRPLRLEGTGRLGGGNVGRFVMELGDYRDVGGFALPFRRTARIENAAEALELGASGEALLAAASLARERLPTLPESQRTKMAMAIELFEQVGRTGSFTFVNQVLEAHVNDTLPAGLRLVEF